MFSRGLLRFLVPAFLLLEAQSTQVLTITDGADHTLAEFFTQRNSVQDEILDKAFDSNSDQNSYVPTDLVQDDAFTFLSPRSLALPSRSLTSRSIKFGNICSVQGQRSVVVGHSIFFMDGSYKTIGDDANVSDWKSEHVLFSLDLETSFPVEDLLSPDFLHNISIPSTVTPDIINQVESIWSGALFATNDTLYIYGGGDVDENPMHDLASYNITTNSWKQVSISGGDFEIGRRVLGQGVSDPISGLSFFTGGSNNVGGMLRLDASNPDDVTWTNQTKFSGSKGESVPEVLSGGLVYLPVGKAGILLLLGGSDANSSIFNMRSMENIAVYDIDSSAWYSVVATGTPDIPNGRAEFCLAVSRAPDDSSFQVTMYGGTLENSTYYDDVWVLSIPSFQWISVTDTNNTERMSNGPRAGRKGHTCTIWDDSQIIVLGGMYASNAATQIQGDGNRSVCDTAYSPIRLLETSTYTWKNEYEPNNVYSVPSVISQIIGGDSSGHSTIKSPQGGWNDSDLVDVFSRTLPRPKKIVNPSSSATPAQHSPTSSTGPSPTSASSTSSKVSKGAIVGGLIGGIAVSIAGIAIINMVFRWRRRKRSESKSGGVTIRSKDEMEPEWSKAELGGQSVQELPARKLQDPSGLPAPRAIQELPGTDFGELPAVRH